MRLFFDTETTGLAPDSLPVELAWALEDADGRVVAAHSYLIPLSAWGRHVECHPEARRAHGLSDETLRAYGRPPELVLMEFRAATQLARTVVGHNVQYDIRIMEEAARANGSPPFAWPTAYCTCEHATPIVRKPHPTRPGYAFPKLGEAYYFFTKKQLAGAHSALADVFGCRQVYKGIVAAMARQSAAGMEEGDAGSQVRE